MTGLNNSGNNLAASPANIKSPSLIPATLLSILTVTTLVLPSVLAPSAYPAAGYTTELVPTTITISTTSRSIHASIPSSIASSNCSPNHTTPGRCRPVPHWGQCGSSETGMRARG